MVDFWMDKTNLILAMKGDFEARAQIINPNVKAKAYDYGLSQMRFDTMKRNQGRGRVRRWGSWGSWGSSPGAPPASLASRVMEHVVRPGGRRLLDETIRVVRKFVFDSHNIVVNSNANSMKSIPAVRSHQRLGLTCG